MPRRPSPGNISSPYGMRMHPVHGVMRMHNGEDIGWGNGAGTTLVAPQRAQLIDYRDRGDWGMQARLRDGNVEHRLSHTARLWPGLQVGQWLDEGQSVAVMGATGMAIGVHLHWEVLINGQYVNPAQWLADATRGSAAAEDSKPITPTPGNEEDEMKIYSYGGNYLIIGPETYLELGDALTKQTGVDGTETLALYRKLGATEVKLANKRDYDVLRINTRASR